MKLMTITFLTLTSLSVFSQPICNKVEDLGKACLMERSFFGQEDVVGYCEGDNSEEREQYTCGISSICKLEGTNCIDGHITKIGICNQALECVQRD